MEQTPSEEPDVDWEARARAYALVSTRLLATPLSSASNKSSRIIRPVNNLEN